jgi:hypothetical protein
MTPLNVLLSKFNMRDPLKRMISVLGSGWEKKRVKRLKDSLVEIVG